MPPKVVVKLVGRDWPGGPLDDTGTGEVIQCSAVCPQDDNTEEHPTSSKAWLGCVWLREMLPVALLGLVGWRGHDCATWGWGVAGKEMASR